MKTHGSHGLSGLEANEWRRMITLFENASSDISKTIAQIARRIATETIGPEQVEAYNACRLVSLDKNPGVRPIGIEVLRRIIGRTITKCISKDFLELGSNKQVCLGQKSGIEFAIHSLREKYEESDTEALLLLEADNAFNSVNRELVKSCEILRPALYHAIYNYSKPSARFVNHKELLSREGTTQGDPPAMAMYGIAVFPLIERVENEQKLKRWYADDGSVSGKLEDLRRILDNAIKHGKHFGYKEKPSKCHPIAKEASLSTARTIFHGISINLTDGSRVLGSIIGGENFCEHYTEEKADECNKACMNLSQLAKISPQNVYSSLTRGVREKLSFMYRTAPNLVDMCDKRSQIK